jgi:DNA repair protein RadA/Sms
VAHVATGLTEFDGAIGGGVVPGSLLLLAGEPGVGKSTLALQVAAAMAARGQGRGQEHADVLYVSGEETAEQVRGRAGRLGVPTAHIRLFATTDGNAAAAAIAQLKPRLAVVDSIQTLTLPDLPSDAGGIAQVRTLASLLLQTAKTTGVPIVVTGHVTKDGSIAGPKTLEHLVDQVALLEGEPTSDLRCLRITKNRFGATDVVGVFTMSERGFAACADPSAAFLTERGQPTAGSAVAVTTFGNRTLLVEVQALVTRSAFGQPQRRAVGVDLNRLHVLIAVLIRHGRLPLASMDVHVATVGGFRIDDPAADLAIAAAVASATTDRPLPCDAYIGEVGLDGSIRPVRNLERRIQEAVRLKRTRIACPPHRTQQTRGGETHPLTMIRELIETLQR